MEDDPTEAAPYGIIVPGPEVPPVPPRKRPKAAPGPSRTHPGVAKGSAAGASAPPPGPIASPVPLPPLPPVGGGIIAGPPVPLPGASAVCGGIIAGPPEAPAPPGKRRLLGREWFPALDGREMQYAEYKAPHTQKAYRNYIIRGTVAGGTRAEKTRGRIPEYMERHGEIEPLAWLHCYLARYDPTKPRLRRSDADVPRDEVDAFVVARRQELWDLFHVLVPAP